MKSLLKYLMFAILGAVLIATSASLVGCNQVRREITPPDSVFQHQIDSYLPVAMQKLYEFSDPVDVISYRNERLRQLEADDIICGLSDQTLANICSVLSRQQKTFGISDIVYEYKTNKRIYDGLPEEPVATVPAPIDSVPSVPVVQLPSDTQYVKL